MPQMSTYYSPARTFPPARHQNVEIRVLRHQVANLDALAWRALKYTVWRNSDEIEAHMDLFGQLEKRMIVVITNADYAHASKTDKNEHYTARVFGEQGEYLGGMHLYQPWTCKDPDFLPENFETSAKWRQLGLADILGRTIAIPAGLGEGIKGKKYAYGRKAAAAPSVGVIAARFGWDYAGKGVGGSA